ncbi:MAG: transposase [Nitrososphaerota archaeon]|nr:transposase [Nitrososphaerota archaeon]
MLLSAIFYTLENCCKWCALHNEYRHRHTIHMRFSRWSKNGCLQRIFGSCVKMVDR